MKRVLKTAVRSLIAFSLLLTPPISTHAWEPNTDDLDAAIAVGDFAGYFEHLSTWLNHKVPTSPAGITEATLTPLFREPVLANALDQRQLLCKHGVANLGAFAQANPENKTFLAWLLRNTPAVDFYLEGATPTEIKYREANSYSLNAASLDIWKRIFVADPESRDGTYLKLAIATALAPPGSGSPGAGQAKPPVDPVERYKHFKSAHQNKELFPSFDSLTVWEYQKVVQSGASNSDLAWAREMLNTWRPDLRVHESVVNSTSEVWRRDSPHPYTDYKSVLAGGGKCGPRSSWSVMICQAFGIPAIGVGQPAHACVAYKAADPALQPQPGSAWKVAYGRGWQVSKLEGMSGPDFLAGVEERSRVAEFSTREHLRWLAAAMDSAERAAAVMGVVRQLPPSAPVVKTDLTASAKAAEAEQEVPPEVRVAKTQAAAPPEPLKVPSGGTRVEAAAFSSMSGVYVYDCFTGGKQVNFQKNLQHSWVDYSLDVPAAGHYALQLRIAAPNFDQVLDISAGADRLATVKVPNTTGLWGVTPAVDIRLEKGKQTLRFSAPFQRGIAVRWFELKSRGT